MAGDCARDCVCLDDFEILARTFLEKQYFDYLVAGCDGNVTRTDNRQAFNRYRFRPQLLRDVSNLDISTTILGNDISCPIAISPTGFHRMVDRNEGERATARGTEARNAVLYGADAILVSNHGGRRFDFLPATIDVLPEVVAAVEGSGVEVYMDGGVRSGSDVFKALARGARAVFIGRPILWGLACNGEEGAKQVIDLLKEEFSSIMALMGCKQLSEITPSMVVHYNASKL